MCACVWSFTTCVVCGRTAARRGGYGGRSTPRPLGIPLSPSSSTSTCLTVQSHGMATQSQPHDFRATCVVCGFDYKQHNSRSYCFSNAMLMAACVCLRTHCYTCDIRVMLLQIQRHARDASYCVRRSRQQWCRRLGVCRNHGRYASIPTRPRSTLLSTAFSSTPVSPSDGLLPNLTLHIPCH